MKATPHLDLKHGIFAQVVGGMDCLDRIEQVETNVSKETPLSDIKLHKVNVFVNPIKESEEELERTVKDAIASRQKASIPSATRSINEQKQAIAASNLAIKNQDTLNVMDSQPAGGGVLHAKSSGPSIGKYLGKQGQIKSNTQSHLASASTGEREKGRSGAVSSSTSGSTSSSSSSGSSSSKNISAEDRVAAFLRSQGGGQGLSEKGGSSSGGAYGKEVQSKKKRKVAGQSGRGFNNW